MRRRQRRVHAVDTCMGPYRKIRANRKNGAGPLPDVDEYLRRRLTIECELMDVFDHAYDFPRLGIVTEVDLKSDRVLSRKFAACCGLIDQQDARPASRIPVRQAPPQHDARPHDREIAVANEAQFWSAGHELDGPRRRTAEECVLGETYQRQLLRVRGPLDPRRRLQADRQFFDKHTNPVGRIACWGQATWNVRTFAEL